MKLVDISPIFVRLALSAGFLSAVAARFNLWGKKESFSEAWSDFVSYSAEVNSFLPTAVIPAVSVLATFFEIAFALLLLLGYKTNYAALGAAVLLLLFAFAMAISYGVKEPLDYSVFAASAGALLLATMKRYPLSIDQLLTK